MPGSVCTGRVTITITQQDPRVCPQINCVAENYPDQDPFLLLPLKFWDDGQCTPVSGVTGTKLLAGDGPRPLYTLGKHSLSYIPRPNPYIFENTGNCT